MLTEQMTPEQRFAFHATAYQGLDRILEERIAANIELARTPWAQPHMRTYYVRVARLQNRMIVGNRRHLRALATGANVTLERPARRPYAPKPTAYAPKAGPHTLKPLEVVFAAPIYAPLPLVPTPWPDGEPIQGALF